jgi:hypothetical protein
LLGALNKEVDMAGDEDKMRMSTAVALILFT